MEVCSYLKEWDIIQTENNTFLGGARYIYNIYIYISLE